MENQKTTGLKVLKISMNVLFYTLILFLMVFSIANIKVKTENDIANVFGMGFLSVQSDSMAGSEKDSFKEGDMVFVKLLDDGNRQSLQVGDVITYYDVSIKAFNTHRIIEVLELDGEKFLYTKGDNTTGVDKPIHISEALAVHQSSISSLGTTLDYLQSPAGFALFVILPVAILLIVEGVFLARNLLNMNRVKLEEKFKKEVKQTQDSLETEYERIRKQVLAEIELNKNLKTSR
ncbi:MAG: signal peptidase I [Tenericutes bacterium]|jgi:signal peptidase I|nr:signal peptidase I [Mycoplasmatota bacterium]